MPTLNQMLEAGVHYGHKKERSHPRAKIFTYTIRDSIYVINLEQTLEGLKKVIDFFKKTIQENKIILFVGTKNQAKESVQKLAKSLKMPFITQRWLGGTLTNFETIAKSLKKIEELENLVKSEDFSKYTKKERKRVEDKLNKLNNTFEGLKEFKKIPDILFIVDTHKENVAVMEAKKMDLPIVAILDTNSNPDLVEYPIPANDDSENSIKLLMNAIEEALKENKEGDKETNKENRNSKKKDENK